MSKVWNGGPGSPVFGLEFWRNLSWELTLEALIGVIGLWVYWKAAASRRRGRRIGMVVYAVVLAAVRIGGQVVSSEVPSRAGLIANWTGPPVVIAAIAAWLDRESQAGFTPPIA